MQFIYNGIVKQPVDGKVPPQGIGPGIAESHLARAPAILVIGLSAESSDLELMAVFEDNYHAKFFADRNRARKKIFDLLGERGRHDVVVIRLAAQEEITHATADPESRETGLLEAFH